MKVLAWAPVAAFAMLASGCSTSAEQTGLQVRAAAAPVSCGDGGRRLPVTGLCQEEAAALLLTSGDASEARADGCAWVVNEARYLGGGALLYRAMQCDGRTARLEFTPGARAATFDLIASPFGDTAERETIATMFDASGPDPKRAILEEARRHIDDPAERDRCRVRLLNGDVASPPDALVVDEVPAPQSEEVRSACGEFGYDNGAQSFWRISQQVAWFFRLGNDAAPVDAGSFTLVRRNEAGQWVRS